ncbi:MULTISPECIES: hypothetical protein [Staphylococcus]|uniref:hypothetical protein n=1 Tax=Staphylococcus TaxID=1279 RepID=UPI00076B6BAB|nr:MULTISPECIES: hypothetical protein [Staphylococcus]DAH60906.1 MAG TPA: hypothetical protein [Caudoviricetes sp.]AMG64663.1 hypothetical protein AL501_10570 [Staphylococcus lugdunensis]MCH8673916.1 hypothetical protein [Staphylococcus lugdunensis]MCI2813829.1 hypothetical protein [Staphylococcus lugdunensis]MDU0965630.1 hypothetical protein [Staphylococcus lugdunensis]
MVKIKTKKEMKLPELIKWGWENNVRDKVFSSDCGGHVYFRLSALLEAADVGAYETFAVEVEEEITEETKLDTVLEIYNDLHSPGSISSVIQKNTSINNIMEYNPSYFNTACLYLINEDMTLTLIWKDGELVK